MAWTPVRLKARFLSLGATDILSWRILGGRGCPAHWSMFSGLPGLYPPDSRSSPSVVTVKSVRMSLKVSYPHPTHMSPAHVENHWLRIIGSE